MSRDNEFVSNQDFRIHEVAELRSMCSRLKAELEEKECMIKIIESLLDANKSHGVRHELT